MELPGHIQDPERFLHNSLSLVSWLYTVEAIVIVVIVHIRTDDTGTDIRNG
jgi:hypothetical protein